jgi:hypothetical protein
MLRRLFAQNKLTKRLGVAKFKARLSGNTWAEQQVWTPLPYPLHPPPYTPQRAGDPCIVGLPGCCVQRPGAGSSIRAPGWQYCALG